MALPVISSHETMSRSLRSSVQCAKVRHRRRQAGQEGGRHERQLGLAQLAGIKDSPRYFVFPTSSNVKALPAAAL